MEITMTPSDATLPADFTNRGGGSNAIFRMQPLAGALLGLIAGPGNALANRGKPTWDPHAFEKVASHSQASGQHAMAVAPAGELITRIKADWRFNMTELAEIMDVQRPTLYNWVNGKTKPDPVKYQRLQTLAAAASVWAEHTEGKNWDYILDYSGPRADEMTIRELLSRADVSTSEIRGMIHERMKQYQEAYARSREILGESVTVKGDPIPESTRKLNKRWTKNAHRLHRARNSSS